MSAHITIYRTGSPAVECRASPKTGLPSTPVIRFKTKQGVVVDTPSLSIVKVVISPAKKTNKSINRHRKQGTTESPLPSTLCKNLFEITSPVHFKTPLPKYMHENRRQSCAAYLPNNTPRKNYLFTLSPKSIMNSVQITRVIGSGGFGSVYLGYLEHQKVAVKKLHRSTRNIKAKAQSFQAEINAKLLRHPNVVRILAASAPDDHEDGFIVMEYVGDKHLGQILADPNQTMDLPRRISYGVDMASALAFIHDSCLVHLDVKPANIFITPHDTCKLGDFGCCQVIEHGTGRVSPTHRSYLTGTYAYRAPELLRGEIPTTKADIYSMGITLWETTSRERPYHGLNQHYVIFGVVANNLRPKSLDIQDAGDLEECFMNVYVQCWHADPCIRPTAERLQEMLKAWKT